MCLFFFLQVFRHNFLHSTCLLGIERRSDEPRSHSTVCLERSTSPSYKGKVSASRERVATYFPPTAQTHPLLPPRGEAA